MTERLLGEELGRAIANARRHKKMTQTSLAAKARVDLDALRGIEQGRYAHPSFFAVMRIARVLSIRAERLIPQTTPGAGGRR